MSKIGAIILAAGKGTRMKSTTTNKVMLNLAGRPMLSYTIDNFRKAGIDEIVVVVGFAKKSIINYFGDSIEYADQKKRLGTAHAVQVGLAKLSDDVTDVLSVYGDDSYMYSPELLRKLIDTHKAKNADMTILTVEMYDPTGLGRIIRSDKGTIQAIVEERVATDELKKIKEINTGCYIFNRVFLTKYLPKIQKNPVAKEYYLTDILEIAVTHKKKIADVAGGRIPWRGVNRPEELEQARKLIAQ
ncbi:NTP transferase domain-containing protein [Candidatus Roizmanbacteria bacterium]|nr:NTP transferase domain-containing protein [Candidatus Roizmanbacteria bacterium]